MPILKSKISSNSIKLLFVAILLNNITDKHTKILTIIVFGYIKCHQ